MGIFYQPPQPPTASNAGTPSEPHVPIGTQGSAPPRRTIAVLMLAVLASWPADLEPRLVRPNEQQQKIAPLTLTYGSQPPPTPALTAAEAQMIAAWWPPPQWDAQRAPISTAWALLPLDSPADLPYTLILPHWPPDLEPRYSKPNYRRVMVAPLTLATGDPPPIVGGAATTEALIVSQWPLDLEPRLGGPNNRRVGVAPLTLPIGDRPPVKVQTVASVAVDWPAQAAPRSLAWLDVTPPAPPADQPSVAFPYGLVLASWPTDLEPRLTRPNDQRQKIAPLTLVYGDAPPPRPALGGSDRATILSTWPLTWPAQTAPPNAGWNVPPILIVLPHVSLPGLIWQAWEPPLITLPHAGVIASLIAPAVTPSTSGPAIILVGGRLALRITDFIYVWLH